MAGPMSVWTTDGAPMISIASDPARDRLSSRQVVTAGAACAPPITPRAKTTPASLMSLRRVERLDQDGHVAHIGIDRNAHQLGIRIRRRVGLVADIRLRIVAGLRRLRAVAFVGMAGVAERRQPIALRVQIG